MPDNNGGILRTQQVMENIAKPEAQRLNAHQVDFCGNSQRASYSRKPVASPKAWFQIPVR